MTCSRRWLADRGARERSILSATGRMGAARPLPATHLGETRFQALSIGPAAQLALPADGTALRVHSVFPSTVNLEVEGSEWLVALSGPMGAVYPHAVALARPEDFGNWGLAVGSRACLLGGSLCLQGQAHNMVVDLRQALRLPLRTVPSIARLGGAHHACAMRLAEIQANAGCDLRMDGLWRPGRVTTALGAGLGRAALALGAAAQAFGRSPGGDLAAGRRAGHDEGEAPPALGRSVAALLGLGAGLTPSGDDFLCGFLAAARTCGRSRGLPNALKDAVEKNIRRTSQISASMVRCAIRNFWPMPLVDLAEALAGECENEAVKALKELCGLGHCSGSDIATGFLFGLETLVGPLVSSHL